MLIVQALNFGLQIITFLGNLVETCDKSVIGRAMSSGRSAAGPRKRGKRQHGPEHAAEFPAPYQDAGGGCAEGKWNRQRTSSTGGRLAFITP